MAKKTQIFPDNYETGEIYPPGKLNEIIVVEKRRANGTLRSSRDYSLCPTLAEQHTGHLTDINYLIEKYKPDELAAYITARNQYRQEIMGHDFASEYSLQEAKGIVYESKRSFEELPENVRTQFKNHLEFLKFIDNPSNEEKMLKLGLLTKKQVESVKIAETADIATPTTTATT